MTTNVGIENHKARNKRRWASKAWKATMAIFKALHPVCARCGRPTQTSHHETDEDYPDDDRYIAAIMDGEPLCNACHLALRYGKVICLKCNPVLLAAGLPGRYYNPEKYDHCFECLPADVKARIRNFKKKVKKELNELRRKINQNAYQRAKDWKKAHPR